MSVTVLCDICKKLPWAADATPRCLCQGFNLDLACGPHKQKGFVGADKRPLAGVDLVFDLECLPWPIASESVQQLLASHILEHVKPWLMIEVFDEMWRVCAPESQCFIVVPHGDSPGFKQDPTHTKAFNEATWSYFDPEHPSGLYTIYRPKPWKITRLHWSAFHNIEVILEPRKEKPADAPRRPARAKR